MQACSRRRLPDEIPLSRHTETELKLAVAREHLDAVASLPVVTARRSGAPVKTFLRSIYYDTVDRRLSGRSAVLRVRTTPSGFVQTLKAGEGLTRHEWEVPVPGPYPDLGAFENPDALSHLADIEAGDLTPLFETRFDRTAIVIDDGAVELALDHGEIEAPGGRSDRISEMELELKSGCPGDLFRLARVLAEAVPLRPEPRTKAARGFALADSLPPVPVKARKLALEGDMPLDSAISAILGGCFGQFAANLPCVLIAEDPEGIHQARVGLRRLRSALGLFRKVLPPDDARWLGEETRWLAGSLGPARDWDVFLDDLLAPAKLALSSHTEFAADLEALDSAARGRRDAARAAARAALDSARHSDFHLRFGEWLIDRGWRGPAVSETSAALFRPLRSVANSLMERRHKKVLKLGRDFAIQSSEERHRVRIAMKKLRYAVDFFRSLHDEAGVARFAHRLGTFQDVLGHLNDVATATRLAADLSAVQPVADAAVLRAAGLVIGWHVRGVVDHESELIADWQDFRAARPFWEKPPRHTRAL